MLQLRVIVLAAGFGERTNGVLNGLPKILIATSDGRTILDHIVVDLNSYSIHIVTNSLFFKKIKRYLDLNYSKNNIEVIDDRRKNIVKRRGALGDLLFVIKKKRFDEKDLFVLPSDTAYWRSFLLKEFIDFSQKFPDDFVTIVRDVKDKNIVKNRFGCPTLNVRNEIVSFVEKPARPATTLVATPFYVYRKKQINILKRFVAEENSLDSPGNIIPYLLKKGVKVKAFVVKDKVIDAGVPADIEKVKKY